MNPHSLPTSARKFLSIALVCVWAALAGRELGCSVLVNLGSLFGMEIVLQNPPAGQGAPPAWRSSWSFLSSVYLKGSLLDLVSQAQFEKAGSFLKAAQRLSPGGLHVQVGRARMAALQGDLRRASELYRCIPENPARQFTPVEIGEAALVAARLGDLDRSTALWKAAGSDYGPYHAGLYQTYVSSDWKAAQAEFSLAVTIDPLDANAHHYLCRSMWNVGTDRALAVSHCQEAVRLEGNRQIYRTVLTNYLLEQGELGPALEEARTLTNTFGNAEAYRTLGKALIMSGQDWEAVGAFVASLDLEPSAWAYYQLGAAYQRLGDERQATDAWERALLLDPRYLPARKALMRVQGRQP